MKTIFFTVCSTDFQRSRENSHKLDYDLFIRSFRKFHPDIEMRVYDESHLKNGIGYLNAKAHFGEILSHEYDLVVNVDADHIFMDRVNEIIDINYDVACPDNYNIAGNNVGIKVTSGLHGDGNEQWLVDEKEFLQGGLIASTSIRFWNQYNIATQKHYKKFTCYENDVLNILLSFSAYDVKRLGGNIFYGCDILGKEKDCYIENDKVMCEGKQVKAYHFGHGSGKRYYEDIFPAPVVEFIKTKILI